MFQRSQSLVKQGVIWSMSRATKLQLQNIKRLASQLGIRVNTKGLTSKEASQLYRELLLLTVRGGKNGKVNKR